MNESIRNPELIARQDAALQPAADLFAEAVHFGPKVDYPTGTFWQRFQHICQRQPERIALQSDKRSVSYGQLRNLAARAASRLVQLGHQIGQPVGLLLHHGENNAIGSLAALAAGGHFVPLNTNDPDARLRQVASNCGLRIVLTDAASATRASDILDGVAVVNLDDLDTAEIGTLPLETSTQVPGYILHTSGSTGTPKGVVISHASWVHFSEHIISTYGVRHTDKVLMATSYTFDVSVMELGMGLLSGATMIVPTIRQQKHPQLMKDLLQSHRVTIAYLPQRLALEMDPNALPDLRIISIGGEAVLAKTVDLWRSADRDVYNIYGPSETTVAPIIKKCAAADGQNPPIGRPIANHYVWLEGADGAPIAAENKIGEIIVGGIGVGIGYNGGNATLNAPFSTAPGATPGYVNRTYRTGDLGFWDSAGDLHFAGRADQQVSLSGVRVELLEVEAALNTHPDIANAIVIFVKAKAAGERDHLKAIIQTKSGDPVLPDYQSFMRGKLPSIMIPEQTEFVSAFEYSASGQPIRPKS